MTSATSEQDVAGGEVTVHGLHRDLQPNAIGLIGATMQCITHISPAIAAFFYTAVVVFYAGVTAPLAYFAGFLVVLMLGNTLVQLSKHLPSAGGYYTYVSRAIHPRVGFITSWMYILYSPLCGGPIYGFFGFILQGELKSNWNIDAPWLWWVCILVGAPLVALVQHRGIKLSVQFMLITGGIEMLIVFALGLSGLLSPGPGGFSFAPFNPANIASAAGFSLAIVFNVQALTGWEAAAPLAEETTDPKRNVPRATLLSIVLIGTFLVIVFWGLISGFGVNNVPAIGASAELPALVLAHKLWGDFWVLLLFAFLNSVFACCLAFANVSTRMWYGMARSGSFPKALAKVDPVYKSPTNAILLQMAMSIVPPLVVGFWLGPDVSFFLIDGLILVIGVTVVYLLANLAVFMFYRSEHKAEFNPLLHVVFPLVSSIVLVLAIFFTFYPPAGFGSPPASPYNIAPLIDGAWLVLGIVILFWMRARGKEQWLLNAGDAIGEA
ncbi:MAG: APC family permease [Candidatus Limnocylindrales bacterium]|jgi:amino acid transporter